MALKAEMVKMNVQIGSLDTENRQLKDCIAAVEARCLEEGRGSWPLDDPEQSEAYKQNRGGNDDIDINPIPGQSRFSGCHDDVNNVSKSSQIVSPGCDLDNSVLHSLSEANSQVNTRLEDNTDNLSMQRESDHTMLVNQEQASEKPPVVDGDNLRLSVESPMLRTVSKTMFHCRICLEEQLEECVARIDPCRHPFCRDCIREYIRTKLGEHCSSILCPECVAEGGLHVPGGESANLLHTCWIFVLTDARA